MKRLHFLITLICLLAVPVASAYISSVFSDIDSYIKHGQDIVVAKFISIPHEPKGQLSFESYLIEVDVTKTLKGSKKPGKLMISTPYQMSVGKTYLFYSTGGSSYGTDFLLGDELSMVEIPPAFDLKRLDGKSVREQVLLIFSERLDTLNRLLKESQPKERLLKEKELLEKAAAK